MGGGAAGRPSKIFLVMFKRKGIHIKIVFLSSSSPFMRSPRDVVQLLLWGTSGSTTATAAAGGDKLIIVPFISMDMTLSASYLLSSSSFQQFQLVPLNHLFGAHFGGRGKSQEYSGHKNNVCFGIPP